MGIKTYTLAYLYKRIECTTSWLKTWTLKPECQPAPDQLCDCGEFTLLSEHQFTHLKIENNDTYLKGLTGSYT